MDRSARSNETPVAVADAAAPASASSATVPLVTLTLSLSLQAIHSLGSPMLSAGTAARSYGLGCSPHGHKFTFDVSFKAPLNPSTGQPLLQDLVEESVQMALHDVLHLKNIDEDVSWFSKRPSTLSNLALFAWRNVNVIVRVHPIELVRIEVKCDPPCERGLSGTNGSLASKGIGMTSVVYEGQTTTISGLQ